MKIFCLKRRIRVQSAHRPLGYAEVTLKCPLNRVNCSWRMSRKNTIDHQLEEHPHTSQLAIFLPDQSQRIDKY